MTTDIIMAACSSAGGALVGATLTHILESNRNRKSERNILKIMTDNLNYAIERLNKDIENLTKENSSLTAKNEELRTKLRNKLV